MDDLQILVKAVVDEGSATTLNSQLSNLSKSLSGSHNIKLRVVLDSGSIKTAQTQLQAIAKQVSSSSTSGGGANKGLQVFDVAKLQADGQKYFFSVKDIVSRAQNEFKKLGKVDITNVFKNAKGDIQSFSASVTKADGVIEKFNFNLAKIQSGSRALKGFVQSNSVLTDKNAGTNLEQTLNYLNRIDTKLADITSKTLTNTSKPLLGDMEQYNQYQSKLQQVHTRVKEITRSTSTLSAAHKREINSMVADLQRYAKELQSSAYAATDLKANTFANQKAELQAALATNIKKWQGSGLFGSDFKASVEAAKTALDSALNPNDLDAYRHKLSLLQQEFRQMRLDGAQSNTLLDAERLNTNIQSAQYKIQNLKQTYGAFVNDPTLLSKWQTLFDESQMVSSQKELTNLNAKVRLFEQQLISAGKHSRSLWGELRNNVQKMASWMVLGGVIAGIMRGVTGLHKAVLELDSAMVELKKVTNETDAAYNSFLTSAAKKSVEIGTSYADFVNSAADFARLGYTFDEASNLSEVANIYTVVGDQIESTDQATSSIISTMKAFGVEASNAISIVDKFNEVGNNFAISSGGIGDAMQRSAAAMAEANNTIDESIALIVAANNVIQDPDVVGTMWKTVSMRIRGAKTELEEAGLETEYMAESTAKLRDSIQALTNTDGLGGLDIMEDEDTFKSTYKIMLGISKVWEKMSDIDQAALLEILAGKRQGNALAAAIANMDDAVAAMQTSVDSEGSALTEHSKWMDSIQAKQQQFQAQYQAFANSFISSELIKGMFSAGTGILGWLTELVDMLGALPTLFAVITPFFNKMQFLKSSSSGMGMTPFWQAGKIDLDNDIRLLDDYNTKVATLGNSTNNLTQRQIIWNDTIGRGSDSLRTAVRVTDTAAVSTDTYKTAAQGASTSTTALGVASKAAAIGVNILKTALNMLISFGIGLAISALISGISKLINKAKEAREAAIQAGGEAADNAEKLYELTTAYIELSDAVSAGTASKNEMLSIQSDLISALGLEGQSVRELQGEYVSLKEAIIAAARQQLQTEISVGVNASNSAKEQAVKDIEKWFGGTSLYSASGDGVEEALQHLKNSGFAGVSVGSGAGTVILPNSTTTDLFSELTFDQIMENYKYLESAMNAVNTQFGGDNPLFQTLSDAYNEYGSALSVAIEKIDETNQSIAYDLLLAEQAINNPETQTEFEQFRKNIIGNVEDSLNYDESGTYSAESVVDKILSQNDQYSDYLTALNERETTAVAISNKMQAVAEALVPKDYEELDPGTSAHFHAIDLWAVKAEEVKEKLRALSDEEFEIAYDAVEGGATTWEEITAEIEKYNSAQEITRRSNERLKNSISGLWKSEDFEDAKDDLLEMASTIDGITPAAIEKLAAESKDLSAILQENGMDAKFLAKILQTMAEGNDGLALVTEDALKLNQALFDMKKEFDEVSTAKSRYDAALSASERDTDFKSYAEAFEALNKQFEAGTVNSNAFWAAAEFLFGDEQLAAWGWSDGLDDIYSAMQKNELIFKDADSAGAGFVERLYQLSEVGKMVDDNGENLLEISKLADGSYDFDIDTKNLDKVAEKLGITKEAVVACLEALSMWGDVNFYDLDEVVKTIDEIGLSAQTVDGTAVNASRLTEQMLSLGKTSKEIHDVLSALQGLDGVTLLDVSTDVDTLTGSLQDLGLATSDGITVSVDYEGLGDLLANLGFTKDEAQTLINKLSEADNITLTNADGEVKSVSDALDHINTLTFTEVTESIGTVSDAIDDVDSSSTDNAVSELSGVETAAESAATKVYSIGSAMDAINGKTTTVYFDVKKKNNILSSIFGFAKGTKGAPGGPSLVGEEGTEIVQSGRYAYLVGTNGAEIVNLNRGDTVFNADDTKRILNSASTNGKIKGAMPAFAWGTINTGQDKTGNTGKKPTYDFSSSGSTSSSSGSGDTPWGDELKYYQHLRSMELLTDREYYNKLNGLLSKYHSNRESYIDDYRGLMEEAFQLARTLADDWFNDQDHQLFLMDKNGASEQDQISTYKKMQAEANRLAEEARAYGLDENSDYIQSLQKQWWDYEGAIEDLYNAVYQGEIKARENTLGLLENQYGMLENNRSSDAMNDNLKRQLAEQKAIQSAAHKEAQRLRTLGVDENDDAVQECIDAWWGAQDSIQEISSKMVDNVLSVYDEFIDYADDFELWGNFDFTKVDYLKQKLAALNRLWDQGVLTLKEYNSLLKEIGVEIYNEQKEALTSIIEMTMELVRQETEDKVDALEKQIDAFQKIIDLKKESLRTSKDEEDYQSEVAKRVKEIAEKQAKLAQLERDTSASTNAEKAKLAQELADLQAELAEYQADYTYNAQVDALDKESDAYEDTKNDEIDYLKSTIDTEEKLYNAAISRINGDWDALYADLIEWNRQYGDMIDGEDSITSAWRTAKEAAEEYGNVVSALSGIKDEISNQQQESASKQAQIDDIVTRMAKNGKAHHTATPEEKKRLVKANEDMAEQLSALINRPVIKDQAGVWHLDSLTGPRLFHTGLEQGYVGGSATGSGEVLSILKKGELVFTKEQYMATFNSLKNGVAGILDMVIGKMTASSPIVSEVVKSVTNNSSSIDNSDTDEGVVFQNHFYLQDMTKENMERFAELYSTYTINKLNSGSRRKGLKNSVGNSMLRG